MGAQPQTRQHRLGNRTRGARDGAAGAASRHALIHMGVPA